VENDLRYGKVVESVRADLENYSAWVSIVPSLAIILRVCKTN